MGIFLFSFDALHCFSSFFSHKFIFVLEKGQKVSHRMTFKLKPNHPQQERWQPEQPAQPDPHLRCLSGMLQHRCEPPLVSGPALFSRVFGLTAVGTLRNSFNTPLSPDRIRSCWEDVGCDPEFCRNPQEVVRWRVNNEQQIKSPDLCQPTALRLKVDLSLKSIIVCLNNNKRLQDR